ncbi:MAG TPA: methionyl-tRNA formyltransferase [Ktedonobacterales bacterium]|nr:methionyl-tRNA formyltransferase [Ktedonobacterales bacterium]
MRSQSQPVNRPARIVYMGTPDFAVPTLRTLVERAHDDRIWPAGLEVVSVVTRPDKPAGRGRQLAISPVKQLALEAGLPCMQPGPLKRAEAQQALRALAPDLIIVAAFGQILPREVLELPPLGCLNVHASLLPRWRGAAPIAAAIRAGDAETGITIMRMEEGLDTGAIIVTHATPIDDGETAGALTERLALLAPEVLLDVLPSWLSGAIAPTPQDDALATVTRPLRKDDGRLDFHLPAVELERLIRSVTPWPGAFTTWQGKLLKVLAATVIPRDQELAPGTCYPLAGDARGALACACGEGALALKMIQLEGKRPVSGADALRGHPALAHATLGDQ